MVLRRTSFGQWKAGSLRRSPSSKDSRNSPSFAYPSTRRTYAPSYSKDWLLPASPSSTIRRRVADNPTSPSLPYPPTHLSARLRAPRPPARLFCLAADIPAPRLAPAQRLDMATHEEFVAKLKDRKFPKDKAVLLATGIIKIESAGERHAG